MNIKYKLKQLIPMAIIASAPFLPISCGKGDDTEKPHHNTTYIWGKHYWDKVWPATKVAASADSVLVDNVILKNDGVSFEGWSTTRILSNMNNIINAVDPQNRHKIRGAGTLNDVGLSSDQEWQDSIKLSQMGFKFGLVHHAGYVHK